MKNHKNVFMAKTSFSELPFGNCCICARGENFEVSANKENTFLISEDNHAVLKISGSYDEIRDSVGCYDDENLYNTLLRKCTHLLNGPIYRDGKHSMNGMSFHGVFRAGTKNTHVIEVYTPIAR